MAIKGEALEKRDKLLKDVVAGSISLRNAAKQLGITAIALSEFAEKHGYCNEVCPVCGMKFITHTAVSLHISRKHPGHCTGCGVSVPSRISKQKRMCQFCFDKFNAERTLKYPPKKYYASRKARRDLLKEQRNGQKNEDLNVPRVSEE